MAEPLMKEDAAPTPARREPDLSALTPKGIARAKELERKLGHPLRMHIDGPLTEEEEEEIIFARLMYEESRPVGEFLEEFKHLRAEKPQ